MNNITELANILILINIPFQVDTQAVLSHKYPQIWVPSKEAPKLDVVCHPYSEGGQEGYLELGYRDENGEVYDVKGYLTASKAAALIMERMGVL